MRDEGVEAAELAVVRERLGARNVIGHGAGLLGHLKDALRWHVQELGARLDETSDQPGTGDAVDLRSLAGNPLRHHTSPRFCSGVSGTVGPPMACQAAMPPASALASRPRRRSSAVASPLTWKPYSQ